MNLSYTRRLEVEDGALGVARWLMLLKRYGNDVDRAAADYIRQYGDSPSARTIKAFSLHRKAAVPAGGHVTGAWGSSLVPPELSSQLAVFSMPFSAKARLGLARAPFDTRTVYELAPLAAGGFVRAGASRIVVQGSLASTVLLPLAYAAISIVTRELIDFSRPGADVYLRDRLARAIAAGIDAAFFSDAAAVTDVSPAGIASGAPSIAAGGSGSTADDAIADLQALIDLYRERGGRLESAVFAMSSTLACSLALSDRQAFTKLTREGGTLAGCPCVASDSVGDKVFLIDQARVLDADDNQAEIAFAEGATVEMDDAPTNDAGTATAANMTSMFQTDSVAIRISRFVNWQALSGSVVYISDASYTGVSAGSPA
jgi:hypothetical protein